MSVWIFQVASSRREWELPELDFSALPATSKKNCRTHEVRHATKTGELQLAGVELTAAALAGSQSVSIGIAASTLHQHRILSFRRLQLRQWMHRMWRNSSPKEECRRADSSVSKTRLQLRLLWFWPVRIQIEESPQYRLSVRLALARNKTASQTLHPLFFHKCMAYSFPFGVGQQITR
ncbi:hypothetical protein LA080_007485 [Diaporthe eres]|nr:hypothetical protein LA080_007485 [Diaporthe eres]